MWGAQMGSLQVDVSVNGIITSSVWSTSGDKGRAWKQGWLDLQPYAGQANVRFRFRAVTGSGELSDIAIDDVMVRSLTPVLGCPDPLVDQTLDVMIPFTLDIDLKTSHLGTPLVRQNVRYGEVRPERS